MRTSRALVYLAVLVGGIGALPFALAETLPRGGSVVFLGIRHIGLEEREATGLNEAVLQGIRQGQRDALDRRGEGDLERCRGDRSCFCAAARRLNATQLAFCNVGRMKDLYTVEIVLINAHNCSTANSVFVTENAGSGRLDDRLIALATRVVTPRESVSQTVARAEEDVDVTPGIVSVHTDEKLAQFGVTHLPELFRLVPGFEVIDSNSGDTVLHMGLPGTMLYMVDGVPFSHPRMNIAILGKDFSISLDSLERVEIVRGPSSVLWGQNAFLGVVNLITRSPRTKAPRVGLQLRLGTYDTLEAHASVEGFFRRLGYSVAATFRQTEGPSSRLDDSLYAYYGVSDPVWGNSGVSPSHTDHQFDLLTKLRLYDRLEFVFLLVDTKTRFEISPFGSLLAADDSGFWKTLDILYALSWTDTLPRGFGYELAASRVEHRSHEYFVLHPRSVWLPYGFSSLQGNSEAPDTGHRVSGRLHHTLKIGRTTNRAQAGVAYLRQRMPDLYITYVTGQSPGQERIDMPTHEAHTLSTYFEDEISLLSGVLALSAGLRYDFHDPYPSALSSQAGLTAGISRLRAKLLFAEGFRVPDMNSLYSTTGNKGNLDLRPERSRALSAQVIARPFGALKVVADGGVTWLTDLIQFVDLTDPELLAQGYVSIGANRGSTRILHVGGELHASWSWLTAFASYTYKVIKEGAPADPLCAAIFARLGTCIPLARHTANLGLSLQPFEDFGVFATAVLVGSRTVLTHLPTGLAEVNLDPAFLVDLGFTIYRVLGLFDLGLKVKNPARYAYRMPGFIDGRPSLLNERRQPTEVFFTLAWSTAFEGLSGKGNGFGLEGS